MLKLGDFKVLSRAKYLSTYIISSCRLNGNLYLLTFPACEALITINDVVRPMLIRHDHAFPKGNIYQAPLLPVGGFNQCKRK